MNLDLIHALERCETDIDGVRRRFGGNDALYERCLGKFIFDPTMAELENALNIEAWDEAFTAAHAMKGLAGNMGFIPLFHATADLVVQIRAGRTNEINATFCEATRCYKEIIMAIRTYGDTKTMTPKGE